MTVGLPMGLRSAGETMAFDYTGKSFTFGDTDDIDKIAALEHTDINLVSDLNVCRAIDSELS